MLKSARLYVGGIAPTLNKNEMLQLFGKYGDIIDLTMKEDYAFIVLIF